MAEPCVSGRASSNASIRCGSSSLRGDFSALPKAFLGNETCGQNAFSLVWFTKASAGWLDWAGVQDFGYAAYRTGVNSLAVCPIISRAGARARERAEESRPG